MRSFIKKLAGTMALTMVVSSVAPAGVVFADDEAFIAMQGGDTMVSSITLATGRTVDFRFVGAPANWAELDPTWTSSIPAVAEVNAAGIVTAKKAGVTTITIALSNGWMATAKVTVKDIPNDAEAPVYLAFQNTLEAVTDAHVLLNTKDGVDFWFINAPEGWEAMNPKWDSSNTDVATVDGAGIVKGVTDGFTTLTFSLNGEVVASTEITVGNPVVEEEPEEPVEVDFVVEGIDARYELYDEEGNFEGYALLDEDTAVTVGDELNVSVYYEAYSLDQYGNILVDYSDIYVDEFEWTSSDEEVVTVEDGVLTAVGAGEATLTVAGVVVDGQEEKFETTVKVVEAAVDESYTVAQKSDKQIVLTFADEEVAAAVKKENLTLVKVRAAGTTNFPISKVEVNADNKAQVIVTTYAAFGDGDKYQITVGEGEATEFTTTLGYVDDIVVTYKSYEDDKEMAANVAYANDEDDDAITIQFAAKLFANDVDVTNASGYDATTVEYALEGEYDSDEVELYEGVLTFYKAGVEVVVKATYTYEDAKEEEQVVEVLVPITSEAKPAYEIEGVVDWAFVKGTPDKIDWSNKSIRANDPDTYIVALIKDSYGNVYITEEDYANDDYKYIDAVDSKFLEEQYSISISSTDVSKMVLEGFEIKTWEKVNNVGVLFTLTNEETEVSEDIYCAEFAVKEERKVGSVSVDVDSFKVLVGAQDDCEKKDIKISLFDQDKKAWTNAEKVTVKATAKINKEDKSYSINSKDNAAVVVDNGDGTYTFKFDADDAATKLGKAADYDKKITVKYTVTAGDKSASFSVELVTPDEKSTYDLVAGDVGYTYATDTKNYVKKNTITFYEYQSGIKYGKVDTSNITFVASQGALDIYSKYTDKQASVGDRFFVLYKGSDIVNLATDNAVGTNVYDSLGVIDNGNGTYELVLATPEKGTTFVSDGALKVKYLGDGSYTAKILEIKSFKASGVKFTEYVAKFKVNNDVKKITVAEQTKLSSELSDKAAVLDALNFKLGDAAWTETTESTTKVDDNWNKLSTDNIISMDVIEANGYMVVKSIKFRVRVSKEITDLYYEQDVTVNKTIQLVQ